MKTLAGWCQKKWWFYFSFLHRVLWEYFKRINLNTSIERAGKTYLITSLEHIFFLKEMEGWFVYLLRFQHVHTAWKKEAAKYFDIIQDLNSCDMEPYYLRTTTQPSGRVNVSKEFNIVCVFTIEIQEHC